MIRLGCLMCPSGTYERLSPFLLSEIPAPPRRLLLSDSLAHLRLHGALALGGVVVTGVGTFMYTFMSAPWLFRLIWSCVGMCLVLAAVVVIPRAPTLRGGCPYSLEASPATPPPRLRASSKLLVPAGLALLASPLVGPPNPALIGIPGTCGAVLCGTGLFGIALAARAGRAWFSWGVRLTALGAALLAYANTASAFVSATQEVDVLASLVSAFGLAVYAGSARDLANLYRKEAGLLPGRALDLRRPGTSRGRQF
ncbi:MAG TPA: hypothetical protein VFN61_00440 [Acidimicrobiales bacterium]|nr:hypothetical protein [Acidimicrobiales bacterium]